ncbi:hypothetical protein MNBD_PLANCTO02-537 [hydrothermal vent metagenome]|uniref:Uncharacterized protein n=1 Tax=hydrothermal vent metagenome TaxID=652676 RepID=A0A3B1D9J9_9ZZZZ
MLNVKQNDYSVKMNLANEATGYQSGNDGHLPLSQLLISEKRPLTRRRRRLECQISKPSGCCLGSLPQQQRQTLQKPISSDFAGRISGERWAPLWATLVIGQATRS